MFDIVVKSPKGETEKLRCVTSECTIGKARDNLVQIKGWSIGGVHARLRQDVNGVYVDDVGGGTTVNDDYIEEEYGPLRSSDVIGIGNYLIKVGWADDAPARDDGNGDARETPRPAERSSFAAQTIYDEAMPEAAAPAPRKPADIKTMIGVRPHSTVKSDNTIIREARFVWRTKVHQELLKLMDLRRVDVGSMDEDDLREYVSKLVDEVLQSIASTLPPDLDQKKLAKEVIDEAVGLGPLEELIADDDVTEIMVNKYDELFVERAGRLSRSDVTFSSDDAVLSAIERIVSPLGRRIDESSPMVDARLKDGSRVNAIIPPLALRGPCITIRKFAKKKLNADDLMNYGSIDEPMVKFLEIAVRERMNVVVSGGTGSGKTTLLNILSNFIPETERIITVEDAAELKLVQPHLVSLESRPPNMEGKGAIPIRDLVKNCLRMRPDRIVVGECRGGEALDMLQAMNTGHDGSLTTAHANSPRDCLSRLEVMVLMSGMDLPVAAIREQVASAVDIILQQTRFGDGSRIVTYISEVTGVEGSTIQMQDIFRYRQEGFDADGRIIGHFEPTGQVPQFYEDLRARGVNVDFGIFGK